MKYLISSTLLGIINQRLIRKNCPFCQEKKAISKTQMAYLAPPFPKELIESKGCEKCFQSSFQGRAGIFELLKITPEIQTMISNNDDLLKIIEEAKKKPVQTAKKQRAKPC
ncbi:hypothetical protein AB751O23_BJ_00020 [Chlamydiales bacterium SCGC AB-751-O23]|nr:hypothetical protein AB751O23_BJ_00020 [Chlamydiales bacterium SCGC AB-751-O23]